MDGWMGVSYVLEGGSWGGVRIFSLSFLGDGGGKIPPSDAVQRGRGVPMSCISAVGVVGKIGGRWVGRFWRFPEV